MWSVGTVSTIVIYSHSVATIVNYNRKTLMVQAGNTNGGNHCTVDLLFDQFRVSCMTTHNFCFYLQNRLVQTSQTGGQWYSGTSPLQYSLVQATGQLKCFPVMQSVESSGGRVRRHRVQGRHREGAVSRVHRHKNPEASKFRIQVSISSNFFAHNLHIFVISQSVCPWQAFPVQSNKHSSLLQEFINQGCKKFYNIGPTC